MAWASRRTRSRAAVVEALGLDGGDGHLALQRRVVGLVDTLAAPLAEEPPHLVAPGGEDLGDGWGGISGGTGAEQAVGAEELTPGAPVRATR